MGNTGGKGDGEVTVSDRGGAGGAGGTGEARGGAREGEMALLPCLGALFRWHR